MRPIVYLSLDGLLEPLGRSQVMQPLVALAERGFAYTVVSLEKPDDLGDSARVADVQQTLARAGVRWVRAPYRFGGTPRAAAANMGFLAREARRAIRAGAGLVHARSYVAATMAQAVGRATPWLFDARGYWFAERADEGGRLADPRLTWLTSRFERSLYQGADAVVQLTQLAIDDLRDGRFGAWPASRPALCIPTCADYDGMRAAADPDRVPSDVRARLDGRRVIAWIGSVNRSYASAESLALVRRVLAQRDDAVLLVLSRNLAPLAPMIESAGIDADRVVASTAPHEDIASWLSLVDWGLMLGRRTFAKRASMPTKLAEFFAMGVRPIQHGFNEEVDHWVGHAGSGHVLTSLEPDSLERAAARIASDDLDPAELDVARERTRGHFDLQSGADRYAELLRPLLG